MKKELSLTTKAQELVIVDQKSMTKAVELLSQLNTMADSVKEEKERLTKPLNEALREVREKYKPVEEALAGSISALRGEMTRYTTERLEERRKAEMKLTERVEKGTLSLDKAVAKLGGLEEVGVSIAGENGSVSFVEVDKFEVVDFKALPDEYKVANEVAIRRAMREGVRLDGVRYWTEQSVRNRR